jgi:lysine 2,3-aminomutase
LREEAHSPVPHLTHRYPDRVLLLVSNECAVYCRFCNRRRKVGRGGMVTPETIERGLDYIRGQGQVREVLLSGGDPFMLKDSDLEGILKGLRGIPHVEVIRISTRVPSALPSRVTQELCAMLKRYHPIFVNVHINHPRELTQEARAALARLSDAGVPLGSQTVLLKGINDDLEVMKELLLGLVACRVRPYYVFQADMVKGTRHFWTHPLKGAHILKGLYGNITGLGVPHFAIDLPEGGGKILLNQPYVLGETEEGVLVENFEGRQFLIKRYWG